MSERFTKFPCYAMATLARSGGERPMDISRDEPDLCVLQSDDGEQYRGLWSAGFGFYNVAFPYETTRDLTAAERERYGKLTLVGPQGQHWPALAPLEAPSSAGAPPLTEEQVASVKRGIADAEAGRVSEWGSFAEYLEPEPSDRDALAGGDLERAWKSLGLLYSLAHDDTCALMLEGPQHPEARCDCCLQYALGDIRVALAGYRVPAARETPPLDVPALTRAAQLLLVAWSEKMASVSKVEEIAEIQVHDAEEYRWAANRIRDIVAACAVPTGGAPHE